MTVLVYYSTFIFNIKPILKQLRPYKTFLYKVQSFTTFSKKIGPRVVKGCRALTRTCFYPCNSQLIYTNNYKICFEFFYHICKWLNLQFFIKTIILKIIFVVNLPKIDKIKINFFLKVCSLKSFAITSIMTTILKR